MRQLSIIRLLAFATCLVPLISYGQSTRQHTEIGSERADFIGNSKTVPKDHVQLESGLSVTYLSAYRRPSNHYAGVFRGKYFSDDGARATSGPEALIRIGVNRGVELRLQLPDFVENERNLDTHLDAISFGSKIELKSNAEFNLAATIMAGVPIAGRGRHDRAIVPQVAISASYQPSSFMWIRSRVMASLSPDSDEKAPGWSVALIAGVSHSKGYQIFLGTVVGSSDDREYRTALLVSGLSYEVFDFMMLDLHGGIGITKDSPGAQIGSGLSIRV